MFGEQHSARRAGKPTAMMTLEPWPDTDQLLFLINGLREAIVHAAEVESEQLRLLRTVAEVKVVVFEPDVEPADRTPLRLAGTRDERIQVLNKLLSDWNGRCGRE
jgi:hypothetical protein